MFVIKNTTDRDVVIADLRVVLGPGKDIDLDKVASRPQIESSLALRMAVNGKMLKVTAKDIDPLAVAPVPSPTVDKTALGDMEGRIKAEIAKHMAATVQKQKHDADHITALTQSVEKLIAQLAKGVPTQVGIPVSDSSNDGISDDIANKMHAKSMKKLEKQITGGSIEHGSTQVRDDDLSKNINELEGLL